MRQKATRTIQRTRKSKSASSASRPASPAPVKSTALAASEPSALTGLCRFAFRDGRTCRLPRWNKHRTLCIYHARSEQPLLAADQAARQLVSLSGEFKTASDINHVLGELFSLVAQNRIPRRNAVALAYIGQLLLQSLPSVRSEISNALGYRAWDATVYDALTDGASASDERDDADAADSDDQSGDESADESTKASA